jgi:hypothetical protein
MARAVLLAVLASSLANEAYATCGDYLHIDFGPADSNPFQAMAHRPLSVNTALPATPHNKPCRGPQCDGAPAAPAPAPVVMPTPHDPAAILQASVAPNHHIVIRFLGQVVFTISGTTGESIFRPPRSL